MINTLFKSSLRVLSVTLIIPWMSFAQTSSTTTTVSTMSVMSVLPYSITNMSDVILDSQVRITRSDNTVTFLDIYLSCFGTNLRAVANPISPNSTIVATLKYQTGSGAYKNYRLEFPARAAVATGALLSDVIASSDVLNSDGTVSGTTFNAALRGNMIRVQMTDTKSQTVDVGSTGTLFGQVTDINAKSSFIDSIQFDQKMPAGYIPSQFMGVDGPLSSNLKWYFAENGKYTTIYASFPGENKFCGGYFSPLVLSFEEGAPTLNGRSAFPLYTKADPKGNFGLHYSWPDFKKEIYFLVLDKNKNGKVDDGDELFGDMNGQENGFLDLALYDENKDGVIDAKDKIFSELRLWKDTDGDGKSKKSELLKLSDKGVTFISLDHKKEVRYAGDRGKILGPSAFEYKTKKGEIKQGRMWDVFLKLVP